MNVRACDVCSIRQRAEFDALVALAHRCFSAGTARGVLAGRTLCGPHLYAMSRIASPGTLALLLIELLQRPPGDPAPPGPCPVCGSVRAAETEELTRLPGRAEPLVCSEHLRALRLAASSAEVVSRAEGSFIKRTADLLRVLRSQAGNHPRDEDLARAIRLCVGCPNLADYDHDGVQ